MKAEGFVLFALNVYASHRENTKHHKSRQQYS